MYLNETCDDWPAHCILNCMSYQGKLKLSHKFVCICTYESEHNYKALIRFGGCSYYGQMPRTHPHYGKSIHAQQ